jgi:hypothetical protein
MSFTFNRFAKHSRRKPGERNKLEAEYEAYLETLFKAGEIEGYEFEGIKLRLADKTWWTADFVVLDKEGFIELHDTKGTTTKKRANGSKDKAPWIEGDAAVKMKVVAEIWPFKVFAVYKVSGSWIKQQF